jgi:5'-nucleotidase/UDP-sugar diphosphatase
VDASCCQAFDTLDSAQFKESEPGKLPTKSRSWILAGALIVVLLLTLGLSLAVLNLSPRGATQPADSTVQITLLQMNDVYELTPVSGGKEGGLARVATIRHRLLDRNPNTFTILAGDLLNPSALSTATVDGERLAGKQMVDVMNVLGLDYATFGNHEFDLSQDQFIKRLAESKFRWFSSNVTGTDGKPFANVPKNMLFPVRDKLGHKVWVGMFGVTVNSNPASYVAYGDPIQAAKEQVAAFKGRADIVVAVTHQLMEDDIKLVQSVPGIDLVIGGHEHENDEVYRGEQFTPIYKADANARTVQIHELRFDTGTRKLQISSRLLRITGAIPDDPEVGKRVDRWVKAAFDGFRAQGFEPEKVVATTAEDLDGREASVRNHPTRLTDLVAMGMVRAAHGAELAVFNSGSIRIDDEIPAGEVTEYDIIRTLPFGGTVVSVQMGGDLLRRVLDQGKANAGTGGYLQTANVTFAGQWLVNGAPLDPNRTYQVAINDFLLTGKEIKLDFLTRDKVEVAGEHGDIRKAFIAELQVVYPGK